MNKLSIANNKSPLIFTICACVGVVATTATAIICTAKTIKDLEGKKILNEDKRIERESAITVCKDYAPMIGVAAATMASIIISHKCSKHQIISLCGATALSCKKLYEYRDKVKEIVGSEKFSNIENIMAQKAAKTAGKQCATGEYIFYEPYGGEVFVSTLERVLAAELELNKIFADEGFAYLNDFRKCLGLPEEWYGNSVGWSTDLSPVEEDDICSFIDIRNMRHENEKGEVYYTLEYLPEPKVTCDEF